MFLALLVTLCLIFVLWFFYRFILNPYRLVQFYSRQGFHPYFYPYKGYLHFIQMALKNHGNIMQMQEEFARKHPNSKGMVFNSKDYVYVILSDLKLKKAFFLNSDKYVKRKSGPSLFLQEVCGDENILNSEHEQWKKRRRSFSKAFSFDFIRSLNPFIIGTCNAVFQEIIDNKSMDSVNVMNMFQEITGRSFVNSFFGQDMSGVKFEGQSMTIALNDLMMKHTVQGYQMVSFILGGEFARKLRVTKYQRELHQKNERFHKAIGEIIRSKHKMYEEGKFPKDNLLSIFFEQNPDLTVSLDDLINEYIIFYIAGTDTTGHLLAHMLLMLLKHPQAKQSLLDEINNTPGLSDDKISWETVFNMPYLGAFMKETLRFRNSVPDSQQRVVLKDFQLDDVILKKGTVVSPGSHISCKDPKYFDNPDDFVPERWMKGGKNEKTEEQEPFLFIPFSAGPRNCIGQHLARFEALIVMVKFLKRFEIEWNQEKWNEQWVLRFLFEPKQPLVVKLKVREE